MTAILTFDLRWNEAMRGVLMQTLIKLDGAHDLLDILRLLGDGQLVKNFSEKGERPRGRRENYQNEETI